MNSAGRKKLIPMVQETSFTPLSAQNLNKILSLLAKQEHYVFLESSKPDRDNNCSYLFLNAQEIIIYSPGQSIDAFFARIETLLNNKFYLAGWFAYEFGYALEKKFTQHLHHLPDQPLAVLGAFAKPIVLPHDRDPSSIIEKLCAQVPTPAHSTDYSITTPNLNISKKEYLAAIDRIKRYIESGDTYQVNYTAKLNFQFRGSPEGFYRTLRENQPVAYSALIKLGAFNVLSFSPELFFRKKGRDCLVRPMKGTSQRGRSLEEDTILQKRLQNDPKNRSENVMIVDLLRNDLGRICDMGQVSVPSLFDVENFRTLQQMTSTVHGKLRSNLHLQEVFHALFPCGSVTGAPKIRTMEIIQELEKEPRGVYTGGIGYFAPSGEACFNVPIRTVVIENDQGEMGIGSGIVYDSGPESEWEECLLKGRFLTHPTAEFSLIETMLWSENQGFWLLDLHLQRLQASANYFQFPCQIKTLQSLLQEQADFWLKGPFCTPKRVRVLLHQDGQCEINSSEVVPPAKIQFPLQPSRQKETLPGIRVSDIKVHSQDRFLYHKTTMREVYELARKEIAETGFLEAVLINERGELTEGTISNIFILESGKLWTPPLDSGLLAGVLRRHLLENYPENVAEKVLFPSDLSKAEAIFIGNSVRGLIEVAIRQPV